MERVKTIWEPGVFGARPSVPLLRVVNGAVWFSTERDWSQECCHGNNIVGVTLFLLWCTFLVPSLKNTAPIYLEIFLINFFFVFNCLSGTTWPHHFPHSHNTKTWKSLKRKEIFQTEKHHSSLLWKAFQAAIIFYVIGTLISFSVFFLVLIGNKIYNYIDQESTTSPDTAKFVKNTQLGLLMFGNMVRYGLLSLIWYITNTTYRWDLLHFFTNFWILFH